MFGLFMENKQICGRDIIDMTQLEESVSLNNSNGG
jgi:hypothetical protein